MTGDSVRPNGQAVKRHRRSNGWTQAEMARRIQDRVGQFAKRTLQSIEAGNPVHLRSIRLVAEELGVDLSSLLPAAHAAPHNLPTPLTSFVGRQAVLAEIRALLDARRLVTLTGAGGSGKSRLALEAARDRMSDHADGVWLVELAPLTDATLVPQAVATALGLREESAKSLPEALLAHLCDKRTLLILDNCEHVLSAATELANTLLAACPQLRLLSTSRETMNTPGEATYHVPPMQLPDANAHRRRDALAEVESVQLLLERTVAVCPDFSLSDVNATAVADLCRHLDGIPLALELAAAQARTISVQEIAERLADRFHLLTRDHRAPQSRHRTLRALIDWSYDLLSDDEQLLFRRLSVFTGGWTLRAAENVCADERIEAHAILDLLARLAEKSLVEVEPDAARGTGGNRYRFLETVRHYALDRSGGLDEVIRERHRAFFLALAEEVAPQLDGADQRVGLAQLEDEHDNLRAALTACSTGDHADGEAGLRLAGTLRQFWDICGYWSEGQAICAQLLGSTDARHRSSARAKVLRTAGKLALNLGNTEEARARLEESLTLARELGDADEIASSLRDLGIFASEQGDFDEARSRYAEGLELKRESGDRRGVASALINLGILARKQGAFDAARSFYEESLAIMQQLGDERSTAVVLANLGNVAHQQASYAEAHDLYSESLAVFRQLGDRPGIASMLNNLGNVALRQDDHDQARSLYEDALAITRQLGDRCGVARGLQNLGNLALQQESLAVARALFEESLAIDQEVGSKPRVAALQHNLAVVARLEGLHAESRSRSEENLVLQRELGDTGGIADSLGNLGLVAWHEGDDEARSLCEQSLVIYHERGDANGVAEELVVLGFVACRNGDTGRAIRLLSSGRSIAECASGGLRPEIGRLFERNVAVLRDRVDAETFARAWSAGQATRDQAVEYALDKRED